MKQLRRLRGCTLQKASEVKQNNGSVISSYSNIQDYEVIVQEKTDAVSATMYGSRIEKMFRLLSPHCELEFYLLSKANVNADNISKYFIVIDNQRYKIVAAHESYVDIEFLESATI